MGYARDMGPGACCPQQGAATAPAPPRHCSRRLLAWSPPPLPHQGYGCASLDQDADELHLLATCLAADHGSTGWVLMGHSTGCQDAVRYTQRHGSTAAAGGDAAGGNTAAGSSGSDGSSGAAGAAARLLGLILQAPVG